MDATVNINPLLDQNEKQELTNDFRRELRQGAFVACGALVLGLIPIAVFAAQAKEHGSVLSVALLAAFASSLVGALAGLLFGVPRGPQEDAPPVPEGQAGTSAKAAGGYAVNTNLVQVSDWLVKIIIGIGLVQFRQIGAAFSDMAAQVGTALGGGNNAAVVAAALLLYFGIFGFITAYISARLILPRFFSIAMVIAAVTDKAEQRVREVVTRFESEAKAASEWKGQVEASLSKMREQMGEDEAITRELRAALRGK